MSHALINERRRRSPHPLEIQRLRHVPRVAVHERVGKRRIEDAVLVSLRPRIETGVETRRDLFYLDDADVFRQDGVQRPAERGRVQRSPEIHARNLTEGVHASIRSSRTVDRHGTTFDRQQRILDQALN